MSELTLARAKAILNRAGELMNLLDEEGKIKRHFQNDEPKKLSKPIWVKLGEKGTQFYWCDQDSNVQIEAYGDCIDLIRFVDGATMNQSDLSGDEDLDIEKYMELNGLYPCTVSVDRTELAQIYLDSWGEDDAGWFDNINDAIEVLIDSIHDLPSVELYMLECGQFAVLNEHDVDDDAEYLYKINDVAVNEDDLEEWYRGYLAGQIVNGIDVRKLHGQTIDTKRIQAYCEGIADAMKSNV